MPPLIAKFEEPWGRAIKGMRNMNLNGFNHEVKSIQ
jgi:hypothetical protein